MQILNIQVLDSLIEDMSRFSAHTRNDQLSVRVARVVARLQHIGEPLEQPLTAAEMAVIRPFLARLEVAEPAEA
jgi:hypothetical protein